MKTWKLLLLALVPGVLGWLCNYLMAVSLTGGPDFLLSLAFYLQAPAVVVFCLWLGRRCGCSERRYPISLLMLAALFSLGFLWGQRRKIREGEALAWQNRHAS